MIRAVLFDVGGPLDLEIAHEAAIDADIRDGLAREGFSVSADAWREANEFAVASFAPSVYKAVIWRLTNGDIAAAGRVYDWVEERGHNRDLFEPRPGIADTLEALQQAGLKLGLVANQPSSTLARLERHGLARYFESRAVSGAHGFRKPDVRLFLRACEDLDVAPDECIMVGDRIDNDIVPARLLGMRTVLVRTGRHIHQQPRSGDEAPDAEVYDASGIQDAVLAILGS